MICHLILLPIAIILGQSAQDIYQAAITAYDNADYLLAANTLKKIRVLAQKQNIKKAVYDLIKFEARCWSDAKDYNKVVATYQEALLIFPKDPFLYLSLCNDMDKAYNEKLSQNVITNEEIIKTCKDAVFLNHGSENYFHAVFTLANVLVSLQLYDHAEEFYEEIFRSAPNGAVKETSLQNYALCLLRSGKFEKAWEVSLKNVETSSDWETFASASSIRSMGWPLDKLAWEFSSKSIDLFVQNLNIQNSDVCKLNSKWKLVLNWTESSLGSTTLLNPGTAFVSTYGSVNYVKFFGGNVLPNYPMQYHERFIYLVHLKSAYISGASGIIHKSCRLFSGGHYIMQDIQTFPTENVKIIQDDRIVASIIQHQLGNFYHWTVEGFARLLILHENILAKNDSVWLLVPSNNQFVNEILKLTQFSYLQNRLVFYENPLTTRYRFKEIYLVDWIHPKDDSFGSLYGNVWGVYSPPKEAIMKVHEFIMSLELREKTEFSVVYVSRSNGIRSIKNEEDVILALKRKFSVYVHTGAENFQSHVEIFRNAKVVVGPHGAGLANLIFSRNGHLVMLPMEPHVEFCFGHLAAALGRRHWIISNTGSYYYGDYGIIRPESIESIVVAVTEALGTIGKFEKDEL